MAIVTATHNNLMAHLVGTFGSLMWSSHGLRLAVLRAQNLETIYEEHAAVSAAIQRRAPAGARDAMLHHIEMIRSRVEGMFGQGDAGVSANRMPTLEGAGERGAATWRAIAPRSSGSAVVKE